jgi:hypothetical protein
MKTNDGIEQIIERGCGLDIHRDSVVATIMGKGMNIAWVIHSWRPRD